MFMLKKTHDAAMAEKDKLLKTERENKRAMADSLSSENRSVRRQLDAALAELAPLKAAKARQMKNLTDANARRKAKGVVNV